MSIIEKAAGKLEHRPPPAAPFKDEPRGLPIPSLVDGQPAVSHAPPPKPGAHTEKRIELNFAQLRAAGLISPDGERSQLTEEYRLIKRPLLLNAAGKGSARLRHGNMIMVTSTLPGEGKTYSSINLAISIALEMDRTVLLVDADVAKPSVLRYLGVKADMGLLDVLRDDKLSLADVLIKTNIPNLNILPAGRTYRRATELLASEAMSALVRDIANRYPDRIVIFDSPPLMATSEASVLASHMGQIVMVVEAEKTPQEALKEALSQIQSCPFIGMLLNKAVPLPGASYYYGYYGRYGST